MRTMTKSQKPKQAKGEWQWQRTIVAAVIVSSNKPRYRRTIIDANRQKAKELRVEEGGGSR
jgi:hypothetical protein